MMQEAIRSLNAHRNDLLILYSQGKTLQELYHYVTHTLKIHLSYGLMRAWVEGTPMRGRPRKTRPAPEPPPAPVEPQVTEDHRSPGSFFFKNARAERVRAKEQAAHEAAMPKDQHVRRPGQPCPCCGQTFSASELRTLAAKVARWRDDGQGKAPILPFDLSPPI